MSVFGVYIIQRGVLDLAKDRKKCRNWSCKLKIEIDYIIIKGYNDTIIVILFDFNKKGDYKDEQKRND